MNDDYIRYVGYKGGCLSSCFFDQRNIDAICLALRTRLLNEGLNVIVPQPRIIDVMNNVYHNKNVLNVGDIYSRYIIGTIGPDELTILNESVVTIIFNQVTSDIGITQSNNKLSIWNSVLGDFNPAGLMPHAPIKIRKKRLNADFNMNY